MNRSPTCRRISKEGVDVSCHERLSRGGFFILEFICVVLGSEHGCFDANHSTQALHISAGNYSMLGQMRQPTPRTNQSEGGNSLG